MSGYRIPQRVIDAIIKALIRGDSYRRIRRDYRVSLSTISRVKEALKRRIPDLEELRALNVLLRKHGLNFLDAARGAKLLDALNKLGVSLDELAKYTEMNEKVFISAEHQDPDEIVSAAIRLIKLEEETGKTYGEIVQDFEEKRAKSAKLEAKRKYALAQERRLQEKNRQLDDNLKKSERKLKNVEAKIGTAVATEPQLKALGIHKLAKYAKFIREIESLNFRAEDVQEAARCLENLQRAGISPDQIEDYIRTKGPLEAQILELESRNKSLLYYNNALEERTWRLWDEESACSIVNQIHSTGIFHLPCRYCKRPLRIQLPTREQYAQQAKNSWFLSVPCLQCLEVNVFRHEEIAAQIGLLLYPTSRAHEA